MATYTDNYQLTKPTYAEQADIGVINSNMNKIDNVMHSSQISLAPAYDSTKSYAEGDKVMYELLMYKCISPTTGVWDGSKWERTTASESGGGGSAELDILGEASGAVASFADGASAGLAKCIAEIVPKQAGSGTPSPDNVRAISGSTSVTVTISDGDTSTTKTTALGQTVYGGQLNVLTGELTITHVLITFNGTEQWNFVVGQNTNRAYITVSDIDTSTNRTDIYSNQYIAKEYNGMDTIAPAITNRTGIAQINIFQTQYATVEAFKTALQNEPLQVVYPLATPQTVQLTPQEVNSLLGQNNISADTGDIDIVYVKASAPIQPNPTGTPTATLSKLGIEGTVFEVPSGGGGSSETRYSITEQKIGTVEDENGIAKDLYERMWVGTIPSYTSSVNGCILGTMPNDYDEIVDIKGSLKGVVKAYGTVNGLDLLGWRGDLHINTDNQILLFAENSENVTSLIGGKYRVIIQYTKITD